MERRTQFVARYWGAQENFFIGLLVIGIIVGVLFIVNIFTIQVTNPMPEQTDSNQQSYRFEDLPGVQRNSRR